MVCFGRLASTRRILVLYVTQIYSQESQTIADYENELITIYKPQEKPKNRFAVWLENVIHILYYLFYIKLTIKVNIG